MSGASKEYAALARRRSTLQLAMAAAVAVSGMLDIATGPSLLPLDRVVAALLRLTEDRMTDTIVWTIRMPIAAMALLVGAALGVSGALMQTILNNPLASSYTLGISAGAGFGAALAIVFGGLLPLPLGDDLVVPVAAFLFAGVACALVFLVGGFRGATPDLLVLAGIALMFLFQAMQSMLQFIASPEALQQIVFWLFGSLQRSSWDKVFVLFMTLALCAPVLARDAWRLTSLRLGDERARALGVRVREVRLRAFLVISLTTGVAVAFTGPIGFIGLVAPHLVRPFVGEDQRILLPASGLAGALLLSVASVASKSIMPGALIPIGVVTALIGVPFFLWLILGTRRKIWQG